MERGREKWVAQHHPFTAPLTDDLDPATAKARAYDLILNGFEIGGGSIRIHEPEVQQAVFDVLQLSHDEQQEKFGHMLKAFRYGAPPHGGVAMGLDRLLMVLAGKDSLRDVTAFPKAQSGLDPMTGAPARADDAQLADLGIAVIVPEEDEDDMSADLTAEDRALLQAPNYAWIVTLNPDGSPQASVTWIGADDTHVLVNTAVGRRKDRNVVRDPHVAIAVQRGARRIPVDLGRGRGRGTRARPGGRRTHRRARTRLRRRAVDRGRGPAARPVARPPRPHRSLRRVAWRACASSPWPPGCGPRPPRSSSGSATSSGRVALCRSSWTARRCRR